MNSPRVLIVDDNALNLELARVVLQAAGVAVDCAVDAHQAVDQITSFEPDLILMDIQMPGMDGLELMRRLKAAPPTQGIVVVAFTAYAMNGDQAKMREAGCDGYIAKPIDVATFTATVLSFLDAHQGIRHA
ncbi:response regulator [Aquabacterium sp. CECT 9606]|uniref:response regulator n=1 Tax=Aquabacterium sp. CECT 9606 TaxID=2845822 RepID=UPI001E30D62A|nr:response regulator [Aquabacterium sp. CECT 9606]CAH0351176.1 Polar-differentiation response regulator DivK [Aquabacterium sp. CECT 9606]